MRVALGIWLGAVVAGVSLADAQAPSAGDIVVTNAWIREAAAGQASTGAYFTIQNRSAVPVTLVGVASSVAAVAELHTMRQSEGTSPMRGMPMGEMMTMAQVARVVVPAKGRVEFVPGGLHVMLFRVSTALTVGRTADLTLQFAGGLARTVSAVVASRAAVGPPAAVDGGR